ncbi:MAG: glycerol-3-phosphate dehydrogenase [Candidatus Thorarchaeota archaeon]
MEQLKTVSKINFDIIVIGGGITGAGIALDATLRGLKVILFEKKDFASGTSSKSSKLVHGGLRYLEHYKFGLVRESLRERSVLRKIAPHQVHTLPFLIPIYKHQKPPAILMRIGLWVYDILAQGNLGWHKWKNPKKTLELVPTLQKENLKGSGYYFDAQMNDSRLNIEVIMTAQSNGAQIFNYTEVVEFLHENNNIEGRVYGVVVQNKDTQEKFAIKGNLVINATGAWGDCVAKMENPSAPKILGVSKGSHIIVKQVLNQKLAVVVTMKDGRITFVLPFNKEYTIIGTTDTFYDADIEEILASEDDISYLLEGTNKLFPKLNLRNTDIISAYSGVRPLVYTQKEGLALASDVSREDKIITSQTGLITIVGGKFTTYRKMGKRVTDLAIKELKKDKKITKKLLPCLTAKTPLFGGEIDNWEKFQKEKFPKVKDELSCTDDTANMLIKMYGSKIDQFISLTKENPDKNKKLSNLLPYLQTQVIYAIMYELIIHLDDFMLRRTTIYLEQGQGLDCVDVVGELMKDKLKWTESQKQAEILAYTQYIDRLNNFISKN